MDFTRVWDSFKPNRNLFFVLYRKHRKQFENIIAAAGDVRGWLGFTAPLCLCAFRTVWFEDWRLCAWLRLWTEGLLVQRGHISGFSVPLRHQAWMRSTLNHFLSFFLSQRKRHLVVWAVILKFCVPVLLLFGLDEWRYCVRTCICSQRTSSKTLLISKLAPCYRRTKLSRLPLFTVPTQTHMCSVLVPG